MAEEIARKLKSAQLCLFVFSTVTFHSAKKLASTEDAAKQLEEHNEEEPVRSTPPSLRARLPSPGSATGSCFTGVVFSLYRTVL